MPMSETQAPIGYEHRILLFKVEEFGGAEHHIGSGMPGPHFRRGVGKEEVKARSRKLVQFLKFTVKIEI